MRERKKRERRVLMVKWFKWKTDKKIEYNNF